MDNESRYVVEQLLTDANGNQLRTNTADGNSIAGVGRRELLTDTRELKIDESHATRNNHRRRLPQVLAQTRHNVLNTDKDERKENKNREEIEVQTARQNLRQHHPQNAAQAFNNEKERKEVNERKVAQSYQNGFNTGRGRKRVNRKVTDTHSAEQNRRQHFQKNLAQGHQNGFNRKSNQENVNEDRKGNQHHHARQIRRQDRPQNATQGRQNSCITGGHCKFPPNNTTRRVNTDKDERKENKNREEIEVQTARQDLRQHHPQNAALGFNNEKERKEVNEQNVAQNYQNGFNTGRGRRRVNRKVTDTHSAEQNRRQHFQKNLAQGHQNGFNRKSNQENVNEDRKGNQHHHAKQIRRQHRPQNATQGRQNSCITGGHCKFPPNNTTRRVNTDKDERKENKSREEIEVQTARQDLRQHHPQNAVQSFSEKERKEVNERNIAPNYQNGFNTGRGRRRVNRKVTDTHSAEQNRRQHFQKNLAQGHQNSFNRESNQESVNEDRKGNQDHHARQNRRQHRPQNATQGRQNSFNTGGHRKFPPNNTIRRVTEGSRAKGTHDFQRGTVKAIGYKKLEKWSNIKYPDEMAVQVLGEKESLDKLINQSNLNDDWIRLLIKVFTGCSKATIKQVKITILAVLQDSTFVRDSLPYFMNGISLSGSEELKKALCEELLELMCSYMDLFPMNWNVMPINTLIVFATKIKDREELQKKIDELEHHRNSCLMMPIQEKFGQARKGFAEKSPPNDYRDITTYPTPEEIQTKIEPFLRPIKTRGAYDDGAHYLDVQFRLLKEDLLAPLREGIQEMILNLPRKEKKHFLKVYNNVEVLHANCTNNGMTHCIRFDALNTKRLNWKHSKKLIFGSLLCISNDNFKTMVFATVADRNPKDLSSGILDIRFVDGFQAEYFFRGTTAKSQMVESPTYFEAYKHVLDGIKEIDQDHVPMEDYIIHCNSHERIPEYINGKDTIYTFDRIFENHADGDNDYVSDGEDDDNKIKKASQHETPDQNQRKLLVPILIDRKWPECSETSLNESQYKAFKSALTEEFAVIQGPPGTGKTYVGLRIADTLLTNKIHWNEDQTSPLLLVCYTNHALDQFLEGLIDIGHRNVVRVGGRASETLEEYSLKNAVRKTHGVEIQALRKSKWAAIRQKNEILDDIAPCIQQLKSLYDNYRSKGQFIHLQHLRQFMADIHFKYFKCYDEECRQVKISIFDIFLGLYKIPLENLRNIHRTEVIIDEDISEINDGDSGEKDDIQIDIEGEGDGLVERWVENEGLYKRSSIELNIHRSEVIIDGNISEIDDGDSGEKDDIQIDIEGEGDGLVERWVENEDLYKRSSNELNIHRTEVIIDENISEINDGDSGEKDDIQIDIEGEGDGLVERWVENEGLYKRSSIELQQFENKTEVEGTKRTRNILMDEDGFEIVQPTRKEKLQRIRHHFLRNDAMDDEEAIAVEDPWDLSDNDRWRLYQYWLSLFEQKYIEEVERKGEQYDQACEAIKEIGECEQEIAMKNADVIAMTTTCAAKYRRVLHKIKPKIVMIEEAAEVLEAHVITALTPETKHLILIGDHKQLKPNPSVYELATKYDLEVSLFERMVNNGVECQKLNIQHRMRPEIARLIRHIYPTLENHPIVKNRDNIKGIIKNMVFVNHEHPETEVEHHKSKSNVHEAKFLARLCKYLLQQGYMPSQITILAGYSGQLIELKNRMPRAEFEGVRVTSVDNYQGEENDIILLSLVRSNMNGKIGFLGKENRVCVALSRAKYGLYVFGNFSMLEENSAVWKKIVSDVKDMDCLQTHLSLRCQNHPSTINLVSNDRDFASVPMGGCTRPCSFRLDCGHSCESVCHPVAPEHKEYVCKKVCSKVTCDSQHKCRRRCHQGKDCGPCTEMIEVIIPKCGHKLVEKCSVNPNDLICHVLCNKIQKICKHISKVPCSKDVKDVECKMKCDSILECGHPCPGTCGRCKRSRLHVKCQQECNRVLVCSHICKETCTNECPPCEEKCQNGCIHSICQNKCSGPCVPCREKCIWTCKHQTCRKLCSELCDRPPCNEPCTILLPCSHPCIGLCGEECPKLCRMCDKDEVEEIFFGEEDNPEAKFVVLRDCGHTFEMTGLDKWMNTTNEGDGNDNNVKLKACPKCNTVIRRSLRYGNFVKMSLNDIENVKKKVNATGDDSYVLKLKVVDDLQQLAVQRSNKDDVRRTALMKSYIQRRRKSQSIEKLLTSRDFFTIILKKLYFGKNATEVQHLSNIVNACNYLEKTKRQIKKRGQPTTCFEKDVEDVSRFLESEYITDNQLKNAVLEIKRLSINSCIVEAIDRLRNNPAARHDYMNLKTFLKKFQEGDFITEKDLDYVKEAIIKIQKKWSIDGITKEENEMIITAIGLGKGHWYKCRNGHYYAIGECGGATEQGKCPECKEVIGGTSHQLVSGNAHAAEFDGSSHASYSEEANNPMNWDPEMLRRLHME